MLFRRRTSLSVPVSPGIPTTPTTPPTPGSPFSAPAPLSAEEAIALAAAKLDTMCSNTRANEIEHPLWRGALALRRILDITMTRKPYSKYEFGLFFDKVNHYDGIFGRVFGPDVSIENSQALLSSNREYYDRQTSELEKIFTKLEASAKTSGKGSIGLKETIHELSDTITRVPETEREPSQRRGSLSASPSLRRGSLSAGKMPERQASLQ